MQCIDTRWQTVHLNWLISAHGKVKCNVAATMMVIYTENISMTVMVIVSCPTFIFLWPLNKIKCVISIWKLTWFKVSWEIISSSEICSSPWLFLIMVIVSAKHLSFITPDKTNCVISIWKLIWFEDWAQFHQWSCLTENTAWQNVFANQKFSGAQVKTM